MPRRNGRHYSSRLNPIWTAAVVDGAVRAAGRCGRSKVTSHVPESPMLFEVPQRAPTWLMPWIVVPAAVPFLMPFALVCLTLRHLLASAPEKDPPRRDNLLRRIDATLSEIEHYATYPPCSSACAKSRAREGICGSRSMLRPIEAASATDAVAMLPSAVQARVKIALRHTIVPADQMAHLAMVTTIHHLGCLVGEYAWHMRCASIHAVVAAARRQLATPPPMRLAA